MDCSLPGSSVHGIILAWMLEWVASPGSLIILSKYIYTPQSVITLEFSLAVQYDHFQRRQWHPTPALLPGKSHGWKNLVGCSPWGRLESDTTERLHFRFSLACIGEGNGNPLQCSCLENPRDRGAWWAAVSVVTHSWTRLKWLNSSSSSFCFVIFTHSFFGSTYKW